VLFSVPLSLFQPEVDFEPANQTPAPGDVKLERGGGGYGHSVIQPLPISIFAPPLHPTATIGQPLSKNKYCNMRLEYNTVLFDASTFYDFYWGSQIRASLGTAFLRDFYPCSSVIGCASLSQRGRRNSTQRRQAGKATPEYETLGAGDNQMVTSKLGTKSLATLAPLHLGVLALKVF